MAYLCKPCNAYVGVHRGSTTPLGTLANAELRELRKASHEVLDKYWKPGPSKMTNRSVVYRLLASIMSLRPKDAHIGMFNEWQCHEVIKIFSDRNRVKMAYEILKEDVRL